ncbi:MAG: M48 family metalloprotease [Ignavibacteria bacterium]|jgi:predicted Zn-dependent protease
MMHMSSAYLRWIVLLPALFLGSCGAINVFPIDEDQRLGAQFHAEILRDPNNYKPYNNKYATDYVQKIVDQIVNVPGINYKDVFAYRVMLIDDDQTINAFCTPGGYIYVYTALLKAVPNEASLACVLAHEIAHAERRHATNRMTTHLGLQTVLSIALYDNRGGLTELAANAFTGAGLLMNSRSDEDEADEYSFKYISNTQWYPGGLLYFFDVVKGRKGTAVDRLFSTHPLPQDRIEHTNKRLADAHLSQPTEAQLRTREYEEFKRSLGGAKTGG